MKIQKITPGFVVQTYDTKTGRCVEQSFIAGDDVPMKTQTAIRLIGGKRKTPTSRSTWCSRNMEAISMGKEMTLADHAEHWCREQGKDVPPRDSRPVASHVRDLGGMGLF